MKRARLAIVAVAVFALGLAACGERRQAAETGSVRVQGPTNELQTILERGVLRVGTTGDFSMSFIDAETGARRGYDIDLTTRLAEDMGVRIEYVATDWPNLVSGLVAGRYDITTGAIWNADRARSVSYTLPISRVGTVAVIRRADAARFDSWSAIDQPTVRVAVREGSVFVDQARGIAPNADLRAITSPATEYQEVLANRADVAITSLYDAAALIGDQPDLQIAPVEVQNLNYSGILVPQGHDELRGYIDAWIRAQETSGYMDELAVRWNLIF